MRLFAALLLFLASSVFAGVVGGPNDHMGHYMPEVDASAVMTPAVGYDNVRIGTINPTTTNPSEIANPSDVGNWRTTCFPAFMAFVDPIVYPNQPGKGHLHVFFGNTWVTADSTHASLISSGNSTCHGGIANRSAYWVPPLIDTLTGIPLIARTNLIYYKQPYAVKDPHIIQPVPPGLKMIAGSAKNSIDVKATNQWAGSPYEWQCQSTSLGWSLKNSQQIEQCPAAADKLWMVLHFPNCWNGSLDSPDHKGHMAYDSNGVCPASHPTMIPQITYQVDYPIPAGADMTTWRLSSDMYDPSIPGGRSAHGDYFMAWQVDVMNAWVTNCIQARRDCHNNLLGDGRILY